MAELSRLQRPEARARARPAMPKASYHKEERRSMFGPHLALDCYQCDQALLKDLSLVYETLDECPDYIGMTKIMPPYVFRYSGKVPEDWGISGVVLIAESHISIHTFPDKEFMSVDIFSCKRFDVERAVRYMTERFRVGRFEQQLLDRGRHFPTDAVGAAHVMDRQRLISGSRGLVRHRPGVPVVCGATGPEGEGRIVSAVAEQLSRCGEPD
jgi:S-adenosylmethionine decarboxylase